MIDSHKGSPMNLTQLVLSSIFCITSRVAFGKKCKEHEEFTTLVKEGVAAAGGDLFSSS